MSKRRLLIIGAVAAVVAIVAIAGMPALKRHSEYVTCGNQMHVVLFVAALEWPREHGGYLPTSFISMSNELIVPRLLVCPADPSTQPAASWASFTTNNCSYQLLNPALREGDTNSVFFRCPIHGYTGYVDDRLLDASGKLVWPDRLW